MSGDAGARDDATAAAAAHGDATAAAGRELRAAWGDLLAALARAREAVDDPALHAPPADPRVLAEGYRYLLGWVHGAYERAFHADPLRPHFRRAIQPIGRSTIDNADALYLNAEIDGTCRYLIRGRAADARHWRGAPPAASGRSAPHYVIVEAATAYAGDSGSIAELRPGARAGTGMLDSSTLQVEADGRFEILAAPERPPGHVGNFVATRKIRRAREPGGADVVHVARHLTLRELFHDWEREDALELAIEPLGSSLEPLGSSLEPLDDAALAPPAPLDPARAAAELRRMAAIVEHQMKFWNEFYAVVLETHADVNGDGKRFMPRNDFNAPNAATLATGGGQSTNVYAGGVYELGPEEALVIDLRVPVAPLYQGFHLANLWGESLDYANHQSSLNGFQTAWDGAGEAGAAGAGAAGASGTGDAGQSRARTAGQSRARTAGQSRARTARYVVAHRDPGVANWLDTTGVPVGFMTFRWTYAAAPAEMPAVTVARLPLAEVDARLGPTAPRVSPEARRRTIAMRRRHVQRRYRQY